MHILESYRTSELTVLKEKGAIWVRQERRETLDASSAAALLLVEYFLAKNFQADFAQTLLPLQDLIGPIVYMHICIVRLLQY